jgi:hypothetical protein
VYPAFALREERSAFPAVDQLERGCFRARNAKVDLRGIRMPARLQILSVLVAGSVLSLRFEMSLSCGSVLSGAVIFVIEVVWGHRVWDLVRQLGVTME